MLTGLAIFVFFLFMCSSSDYCKASAKRNQLLLLIWFTAVVMGTVVFRRYSESQSLNLQFFHSIIRIAQLIITTLKRWDGEHIPPHLHSAILGIREILINILLFMPLGFIAPRSDRQLNRIIQVSFLSLSLSLFIEVNQFVFHRGFCDVDDLLSNWLGTIIGWSCQKQLKIINKPELSECH